MPCWAVCSPPGGVRAAMAQPRTGLGPGKLQELGVEPVLVRVGKTMWRPGINDERRMRDQPGCRVRRCPDWYDLIVVAVDDQRRLVELLQVLSEVRFRKRLDA